MNEQSPPTVREKAKHRFRALFLKGKEGTQHRNYRIQGWIVESTFKQPLVSNVLHWFGLFYIDTNLRLFLLEHNAHVFSLLFKLRYCTYTAHLKI